MKNTTKPHASKRRTTFDAKGNQMFPGCIVVVHQKKKPIYFRVTGSTGPVWYGKRLPYASADTPQEMWNAKQALVISTPVPEIDTNPVARASLAMASQVNQLLDDAECANASCYPHSPEHALTKALIDSLGKAHNTLLCLAGSCYAGCPTRPQALADAIQAKDKGRVDR